MTKYLALQSNVFMIFAFYTVFASFSSLVKVDTLNTLSLVLVVAMFGVPHGALDTLFAKKAFTLNTAFSWFIFISAYLSLSAIVLVWWFLFPTILFMLFLGFSAVHFADDLRDRKSVFRDILYGLNIIILPSIFYSNDLAVLYGYLIDSTYAVNVVNIMRPVAILSALLTLWVALTSVLNAHDSRDKRPMIELMAVSALMSLVQPLLAFTIYFCLMHSARHIIRAKFYFNEYSNAALLIALVIPTLAVIVLCALTFQVLPTGKVNENLIRVTFATLAALTFPHAFLLSKVGFMQWLKSHSSK